MLIMDLLQQHPAVPSSNRIDEYEFIWDKLKSAIRDIHLKNIGTLTFEQLYRHGYKIVTLKMSQRLYENVVSFERDWFETVVMPPLMNVVTSSLVTVTLGSTLTLDPSATHTASAAERRAMGDKFLKDICDTWNQHNTAMNMIADVLMYLERGWSKDASLPGIYAATIGLFRDHVLHYTIAVNGLHHATVLSVLTSTMIDLINMERDGDTIDKALLRNCVYMLNTLHKTDDEIETEKLYTTEFEPEYLRKSRIYYKAECQKLLRESDASSWLRNTERRISEEIARCHSTVTPTTTESITKVVEDELIRSHLEEFMNLDGSGIRAMIDNDRTYDLAILYSLICRVDPTRDALRHALSKRVIELGHDIQRVLKSTNFAAPRAGEEDPAGGDAGDAAKDKPKAKGPTAAAQQTAAALKWVDDVLILKTRFDRLWTECFEEDLILQTALTKSFSDFINSFDRSSEFLSLFIDDNLKRGIKDKTEAEIDTILEKAITLLRYITDKDRFEAYYQKHLARRLLKQTSQRLDVETEMISRMKRELGNSFTHKFEGMFKDLRLSKDEVERYSRHLRGLGDASGPRIELNVNVLSGNNWPKEIMGRQTALDRTDVIYPRAIKALQKSFVEFYSKGHQGRKLTWVGATGTADVTCVFPKIPGKTSGPLARERRYEINVTTYGMVVLDLFNDLPEGEWLTFEDIQAQTNIPTNELISTLTPLSVIKTTKVLLKDPMTKGMVKPTDKFTFNREFVSKTIKIKMQSVNSGNKVENEEERKATTDKTNDIRKYIIDAAVVRTMK
jgi:cullin 3